ncbi:DUF5684 domain-containing protein [Butyrivibrio sp. AD3002]|uniref:DUF5684 domain-containing protein n=1 Tax=Butyrivibrio sp. AD3002 TaxID=1280670 RepID=UPI0003B640E7|nr:DUF5684 domain-containing protein [Butyrivibrio sp. AD3002]
MTESMVAILGIVGIGFFTLLIIIANWRIFKKAGLPGWYSIIPVYNIYLQYKLCWEGWIGIVSLSLGVVVAVMSATGVNPVVIGGLTLLSFLIQTIFCFKLAKAFGKGFFMGLVLMFTAGLGRVILGFGRSRYVGSMA